MAYPSRSHGIYEGPGTTRHFVWAVYAFITERLPAGEVGAAAKEKGKGKRKKERQEQGADGSSALGSLYLVLCTLILFVNLKLGTRNLFIVFCALCVFA